MDNSGFMEGANFSSDEIQDAEINTDIWSIMALLMMFIGVFFILMFIIEKMDKKEPIENSKGPNFINFYLTTVETAKGPECVIKYNGDTFHYKNGIWKFIQIIREAKSKTKSKVSLFLQGDSTISIGSYFWVRNTIHKNIPKKHIRWESNLYTGLEPN